MYELHLKKRYKRNASLFSSFIHCPSINPWNVVVAAAVIIIIMSTQALAVEPPVCPISAAGGKSKHKLINQSAARLAYKVKSSNNSNYGVNHIFGFCNVGETVDFEITRKPGKPKADKLVIMFTEAPADASDPKPFFEPNAPKSELAGEVIVKLSAAE